MRRGFLALVSALALTLPACSDPQSEWLGSGSTDAVARTPAEQGTGGQAVDVGAAQPLPYGWTRTEFLGLSFGLPRGATAAPFVHASTDGQGPQYTWFGPRRPGGVQTIDLHARPAEDSPPAPSYEQDAIVVPGADQAYASRAQVTRHYNGTTTKATVATVDVYAADRRYHVVLDVAPGDAGLQTVHDYLASLRVG